MPMPFPGMDPYLEDPDIWSDYHTTLLLHLRAEISERLPDRYVARLDRYVWIREPDDEEPPVLREPDVFVAEDEAAPGATATAVVALNAPATSTMPAIRRK